MHQVTESWDLFAKIQDLVADLINNNISLGDFYSFQTYLSDCANRLPSSIFFPPEETVSKLKHGLIKEKLLKHTQILGLPSLDEYSKAFLRSCRQDSKVSIPNIPRRIEHMFVIEYFLLSSQTHNPDLYRKYKEVKLTDSGLSLVALHNKHMNYYLNCFPDLKHFDRSLASGDYTVKTQAVIDMLAGISSIMQFVFDNKAVQHFKDQNFGDFLDEAMLGLKYIIMR